MTPTERPAMTGIAHTRADKIHSLTVDIYRAMPGAQMPPFDEHGFYLWGDVDGTPEWAFCETIARAIVDGLALSKASGGQP